MDNIYRNRIDNTYKIYECECGKKFIPTPMWVYKIKSKYYCSYTCYRKAGAGDGTNHKSE